MAELAINIPANVASVSDHSSPILELLEHKRIGIGTRIEIKKRFEFDHSIEVKINRQSLITITRELAENIYVTSTAHQK